MTTTNIVNVTPHAVVVTDEAHRGITTFPPSGKVARCGTASSHLGTINGLPLVRETIGKVYVAVGTGGGTEPMPEPQDGVLLLVSRVVFDALPERSDLVYPTRLVRDDDGRVVGCAALGGRAAPERSEPIARLTTIARDPCLGLCGNGEPQCPACYARAALGLVAAEAGR